MYQRRAGLRVVCSLMLVRVATCRDVLEESWLERSVFTDVGQSCYLLEESWLERSVFSDVGQSWLLSLLVKYWYIAV